MPGSNSEDAGMNTPEPARGVWFAMPVSASEDASFHLHNPA